MKFNLFIFFYRVDDKTFNTIYRTGGAERPKTIVRNERRPLKVEITTSLLWFTL